MFNFNSRGPKILIFWTRRGYPVLVGSFAVDINLVSSQRGIPSLRNTITIFLCLNSSFTMNRTASNPFVPRHFYPNVPLLVVSISLGFRRMVAHTPSPRLPSSKFMATSPHRHLPPQSLLSPWGRRKSRRSPAPSFLNLVSRLESLHNYPFPRCKTLLFFLLRQPLPPGSLIVRTRADTTGTPYFPSPSSS